MVEDGGVVPALTEEMLLASPVAKLDPELRQLTPYARVETEYVGVLRGPLMRWWKPLLAMSLAGFIYIVLSTLVTLPILVESIFRIESGAAGNATTVLNGLANRLENSADPFGIATALLSIICFIPAVLLANRIVFGAKPGVLGSVAGHLRWGLLFKCVAGILLPYLMFLLVLPMLSGAGVIIRPKSTFWLSLLVVLLLTPLQAAAEEYAFRGWVFQAFGCWFKNPNVAWVVLAPFSVLLFVLAHAASDIYINVQLGIFAVLASLLIWRTGGLEAGIALHATNNTLLFILDALSGGASNSSPRTNTSTLTETLIYLVFILLVTVILWGIFRHGEKRSQYHRDYQPTPISAQLWEHYQ